MENQKDQLLDFLNAFADMGEDFEKIPKVFEKLNFNADFIKKISEGLKDSESVKDSSFFKSTNLAENWDDLSEEKKAELSAKFEDLKNNFGNAESVLKSVFEKFGMSEDKLKEIFEELKIKLEGTYAVEILERCEEKLQDPNYVQKVNDISLTFFDDFKDEMDILNTFLKSYKTSNLNQNTIKELLNKVDSKTIVRISEKLKTKFDTIQTELDFEDIDVEKLKEEIPEIMPKLSGMFSFLSNPLLSGLKSGVLKAFGIKQKPRESERRKQKRRAKQYRLEAKEKLRKRKKAKRSK